MFNSYINNVLYKNTAYYDLFKFMHLIATVNVTSNE